MTVLRTLLVGVDHPHGPLWRASLRHHPGFMVTGAVDADPARAATLLERERLEIDVSASLDEAIARLPADAAVVTLPNDVTPAAVATLAQAGVPVLAEKPGAVSAQAFQPALDAIRAAGVPFLPAYLRRVSPVAMAIRDLVREGRIGALTHAEISFVTADVGSRNAAYLAGRTIEEVREEQAPAAAPPGRERVHWLFDNIRSGGGVMHWLGVHWLDLLHMVTGEEVAEVGATLATRTALPIDVEDVASVSLTLSGGAIATVTCAYALPSGPDRTRIALHGRDGWIAWDGSGPEVRIADREGAVRVARYDLPARPGYAGGLGWAFLDAFHAAVTAGAPLPVDADAAMRVLEVLDAIRRSHREGRRVRVGT